MNSKRLYLLILVVVLTFTLSFGAVFAQTDVVTCDADLILNLYIAERYFGYSSFNSEMPADMMIDLDSIDKGQYGLLFDNIDPDAATVNISDNTRANMTDMMAMSDEEFETHMTGMMAADAATLPAATVSGEPEACAALRASLHRFFTVLALNDVEMSSADADDGDAGIGGGTDTGSDTQEGVIAINLTGAAEVPGPGDEDASGTATVYLRTASNEVCVDISVQNITLPATAAHIHEGA